MKDLIEAFTPYLFNPYTGTIMLVIAIGYVVRLVPFISNRVGIPIIGIAVGSLFFAIVAPITLKPDPSHTWNWYVMLWGVGLILSATGWLIHLTVITYIEDALRRRFPAIDDWFVRTSDHAPDDKPPGT